jgi:tRNA(fMet)-specific endonuclease VapC
VILKPCVLDTSLVSMIIRKDTRAVFYEPHLVGFTQTLSFQTMAEMREGALLSNWGDSRRQALEEFLRQFVVAPFSDAVASEWARIRVEGKKAGARLEVGDAWVAATAASLGAPLLTHDGDFSSKSCPGITVIRYDDTGKQV